MPMMVKEDVGIVEETVVVCRSPRIDKLLFSIIVRVYFYVRVLFNLELESWSYLVVTL